MKVDRLKMAPVTGQLAPKTETAETKPFSDYLSDAIGEVNKLQNDASDASVKLAAGQIDDLSQVTVATEKATIALQLTMQVRNKAVDAYQEIMRMQV